MAAIPFTWRVWANENTIKIIVFSYSITAPTITLAGNAPDSTIASSAGTNGLAGGQDSWDGSTPAMYTWVATWAGLAKATKYALSVTQGTTRTANPNTLTGAGDLDPFHIYGLTCDRAKAKGSSNGCFADIRADYVNNVGVIVTLDDHGYSDFLQVPSATGGSRWAEYNSSTDFNTYGRCVKYAAFLGLADEITPDVNGTFSSSPTFFHDTDRIWCYENIPCIISPGDHEYINDPEGNAFLNAIFSDLSAQSWDETLGALQSYINLTNSHATRDVVGPCEIIMTDGTFSLTELTQTYDKAAQVVVGGTWLNSAQITDMSNAYDAVSPFKILGMGHIGSKYFMDRATRLGHMGETPPWKANSLGTQEPLHDYTLVGNDSEWLQITSDKTAGIYKNNTLDYNPVVIALKGNLHRPHEVYHYFPEDPTHNRVDFYEVATGSISANTTHTLHPSVVNGFSYNGSTQAWNPEWIPRVSYNDAAVDPNAPPGYVAPTRSTYIRMEFSYTDKWECSVNYISTPHDQVTGLPTGPAAIDRTTDLFTGISNAPDYYRYGSI